MSVCSDQAWNNFVMRSNHASYERGSDKRTAAIAALFMGGANNGGLNSFLTASHDVDADEVLNALTELGAANAAHQLEAVLQGLQTALPASTEEDRWRRLEEHWDDSLDQYDALTQDAGEELLAALGRHVAANEEFYSRLD